jgi:hypothetical protein
MTLAALMLFDQAVFAGQFLSGTFGAVHTHRENATYAGIAVRPCCAGPAADRSGRCGAAPACSPLSRSRSGSASPGCSRCTSRSA